MQDRLERIADVYGRAIALPAAEQDAFVRAECGEDKAFAREVNEFLARGRPPDEFLGNTSDLREVLGATLPAANLETVGTFRILAELGRGGMGVVYLAEQANPRRLVALKKLRPDCTTPALLARFDQEVEVLGRLTHPHIAQIYEAGVHETARGPEPFLALELVQGRTITTHARDWKLTTSQRLTLLASACDAVQYAHDHGVVHRDLKPANILVVPPSSGTDGFGEPKVLDFGVARITGGEQSSQRLTTPGILIGTVPYMSPEQLGGQVDEIDARSDVYSLGVVGYELLCGRAPFELSQVPLPEVARILSKVDPTPVDSIDPGLAGPPALVIQRAMEKRPDARFQTAHEFACALREAAAGGHAGMARRTRLPFPPNPSSRWLGTAIALAVLLSFAYWLGARKTGRETGKDPVPPEGVEEVSHEQQLLERVVRSSSADEWEWIHSRVALGNYYLEEARYEDSIDIISDALRQAAEIAPTDPLTGRIRIQHGLALAAFGSVEEAVKSLEEGVRQLQAAGYPDDPWIHQATIQIADIRHYHGEGG